MRVHHMTTTPQAALLSESEIVACIAKAGCIGTVKMSYESGPYDIDRPSINASRLYDAVESAILAKLQATQEPVQAAELPDEREAFKNWVKANSTHTPYGAYGSFAWDAWKARAALSARKPLTPLIARQLGEWHEDDGPVMWWAWNGHGWAGEPAWCGQPTDSDWPGYHTHWTPHPQQPATNGIGLEVKP